MTENAYGTTWWGQKWLEAFARLDVNNRIPRGKAYADEGKVKTLRFEFERGIVKARVEGNYDPFYALKLTFPPIPKEKIEALVDRVAEMPLVIAKLAAKELSPDVAEVADELGIELFPTDWTSIGMKCSCPDDVIPCKHIAAVIYKLSEAIDADPFLLFTLHGVDLIEEMEERGITMEAAQTAEVPSWRELLAANEGLRGDAASVDEAIPADWLDRLKKLTFRPVTCDGAKIRSLFAEKPAGYIHGDMRAAMAKVATEAAALVKAQMRAVIERTIPEYDEEEPLIAINTWGQAVVDTSLFWREKSPGGRLLRRDIEAEGPNARMLHEMFSGFITNKLLAESPRELEALYDAWLLAGRLVEAGAVVPQIYEAIDDVYAVRWIPAVMDEEVRALTFELGEIWKAVPQSFFRISKIPVSVDPLLLGEIVLGIFIQSYVSSAWKKVQDEMESVPPELEALFGCEPVDCDGDHEARAVSMRLAGWMAPLHADQKAVTAVVVLHDLIGPAAKHPELVPLLTGEPEVLDADEYDEDEEDSVDEAYEYARVRHHRKRIDGQGDRARVITADEVIGKAAVGIELRFAPKGTGLQESLGLIEILDDPAHKAIRFECLRMVSRLSGFCPHLALLLKNRESVTKVTLDELAPILFEAIPTLRLLGVKVLLPRGLKNLLTPQSELALDTQEWKEGGFFGLMELLQFDWRLAVGSRRITPEEFEMLAENAGRVVHFHDEFVYVDPKIVLTIRKRLAERKELSKGDILRAALSGEHEGAPVRVGPTLRSALQAMFAEREYDVPKTLQATLRPYQERGYAWMMRNIQAGMGSIIADDMGLGKTLQVITVLERLRADSELTEKHQALVVVPTSLLANWTREVARFAPELKVSLFYGPQRNIAACKGHIILTTYGTLRRSQKEFAEKHFRVLVIDEAQAIKNHRSAAFKAIEATHAASVIAMSGTPVENRLMDYWSVMEATNPGLLGSSTKFASDFAGPIENGHSQEVAERFRKITAPFILRRLKTDKSIISDLPEKVSTDEYCTLTKAQTAIYHSLVKKQLAIIESVQDQSDVRRALVLSLIMNLKQICNTPALYQPEAGFDGPETSGKMERLFEILDEMRAAGRKTLIFTQFVQMGTLLQDWIEERTGKRPSFIHGGLSATRRQNLVDRFQNRRDENVMILSLKAAGTGLNLTAASAVVHYDLWWNAAAENQATDRAYRIGQTQVVNVYRFISANTFEERINSLIEQKKRLIDVTVASGENWIGDLTADELQQVFSLSETEENAA